jgi:ABC-2 type transport system ATP-binding protein
VIALDTPAGIVSLVDAGQRVHFRLSVPLDDSVLTELPEVSQVTRNGATIVVSGRGNLLHAVTAALARHRIVAHDLRSEQANLDDAFIALTRHKLANEAREISTVGMAARET